MNFPTPFNGSSALYPVTRTYVRPVEVLEFSNFTEQRWKTGLLVERFVLELRDVGRDEMLAIRTHFDASKGSFDKTWSIDLGGFTYGNMQYASDDLQHREHEGRYEMRIELTQVKN